MIRVFPTTDELAAAAADAFTEAAVECAGRGGRFHAALSGGHSPLPVYRLLAESPRRETIPWEKTRVFWSDERLVPPEDERSNAGAAMKHLLSRVPEPKEMILPAFREGTTADEAARRYEESLRKVLGGNDPRLDFVFLGCGGDGHTASLFPNHPVLDEQERWTRAVRRPAETFDRLTLTLPLLNRSRRIAFLVYGETKAEAVAGVLGLPPSPDRPASLVRPDDGAVVWFLDESAAARLPAHLR